MEKCVYKCSRVLEYKHGCNIWLFDVCVAHTLHTGQAEILA